MTIRIPEIVRRACYDNGEYTPQEVADYISNKGDDSFMNPTQIEILRSKSLKELEDIVERRDLSMDQKLQGASSEAEEGISNLLRRYSGEKIRLIQRGAAERHIWA